VRFIPTGWKGKTALQSVQFSDDLVCILEFQGFVWPQGVDLYLKIGPGKAATRKGLYDLAQQSAGPFEVRDPLAREYLPVYKRQLLDADRYEQLDLAGLASILRDEWAGFVRDDLPRVESAISPWIAAAL
jgi:hypothetical protein